MATIIVDCETVVEGESSLTAAVGGADVTYTDKVEAIAIHDHVAGSFGSDRGLASEIQLVRHRDRASPKLAQKCAAGHALGTVTIYVFKNDNGPALLMKLALTSAYVSRIEYGTVEGKGIAFRRHGGGADLGAATGVAEGSTVNDYRGYSRNRARPAPNFDEAPGTPTEVEVERVWLNYATVTWTSADGNISGSFNNGTGRAMG